MAAMKRQLPVDVDIAQAIAICCAKRLVPHVRFHALETAASLRVLARVQYRHAPWFRTSLMHFHCWSMRNAEIERYVRIVQRIVGDVLLNYVPLIPDADDEVVHSLRGVDLHDMPENRSAADLDHRLWAQIRFFAKSRAETTR